MSTYLRGVKIGDRVALSVRAGDSFPSNRARPDDLESPRLRQPGQMVAQYLIIILTCSHWDGRVQGARCIRDLETHQHENDAVRSYPTH